MLPMLCANWFSGVPPPWPGVTENPIVFVNDGFERLTGYGSAEVLDHNGRLLPDARPEAERPRPLADAVRDG